MNKVKVLAIFSVGMFVINLVLIWVLVFNKPPHPKNEGPKRIIIEKLHFDASQKEKYEELIKWHKSSIRKLDAQMMALKNQLYLSLQTGKSVNATDSLITEIGKVQIEIEQTNYKHFQDIKQLCKPDQLTYFDELCNDIATLFARKPLPAHDK